MMKYSTLLLSLFVVLSAPTVFSFEIEEVPDQEEAAVVPAAAPLAPPAEAPPPPALVAEVPDADDVPPGPVESCLFSIYQGSPAPVEESEDIVVRAYDFDTDFYTRSNLGDSVQGYSFFLSRNNMLSTSASFNILDTTGGLSKQWECSRSKRLRRGSDSTTYDTMDDDDTGDAAKTTAEINARDQWDSRANGAAAVEAGDRSAVYFVRAGTKTFRVACSVENGFLGAHKNRNCNAVAVNGGASAQTNVKVCEPAQEDTEEFIEKSLRRRERFLDRHPPRSKEGWMRLRAGYDAMKQSCSSLISTDHGAKDALHDLGKEINEKLGGYNRNNRGPGSVEPVVVSGR